MTTLRRGLSVEIHNAYTTIKMRERHQRLKQKAVAYKGGRCEVCGYDRSTSALEFHHRDPEQKDFTLSGRTRSWERTKSELDKCSLLCANCHREEHDRLVDAKHSQLITKVRAVVPERGKLKGKVSKNCEYCGAPFISYEITNQRFCSKSCRGYRQKNTPYISNEELGVRLQSSSLIQVAAKLGMNASALRMRCRRHNIPWTRYKHGPVG